MLDSCILTHIRFGTLLIFNELQMVSGGTAIAKPTVMIRTTEYGYSIDKVYTLNLFLEKSE